MSRIHPQARTTPRTRAEINASTEPVKVLAQLYNITVATARKWHQRGSMEDRSHCPHKLSTVLTPAQEAVVVELRRLLLLPLDDLLVVTREFINPAVSRSGLDRCLRRHGVANLKVLLDQQNDEPRKPPKTFKDYEPGFIHIDIKYLPQMPDERSRRYLFVAIDRATRWVYMRIYRDQSELSSSDFLRRLSSAAPMKIKTILTDNGSQFTDRFTSKKREPTGRHAFDQQCALLGYAHRLCPPRHPQTNGMVERFNGRISEVVKQTRFASAAELETTLMLYLKTYNHSIAQRALKHLTPVAALKKWQQEKPELFVKRVYNQAGLDTYLRLPLYRFIAVPFSSVQLSSATKSMYCCLAASAAVPLSLFQASHLARSTTSVKPGFFSALSPALACLYRAYIFSKVTLSGRSLRFFELATAASKLAFKSDMGNAPWTKFSILRPAPSNTGHQPPQR